MPYRVGPVRQWNHYEAGIVYIFNVVVIPPQVIPSSKKSITKELCTHGPK